MDRRIFWFTKEEISFVKRPEERWIPGDGDWGGLNGDLSILKIHAGCGMVRNEKDGSNGGRKIIVIIWKIVNRVKKSVSSEMITVVL